MIQCFMKSMSIEFFTQFLGKKVDILLVTALRGIKELDQCQSLEWKPKTKHVNNLKLNTFPCQLHSVALNTKVL